MIETKSQSGNVSAHDCELLINGHPPPKDFLRQALNNTYWLRDALHAHIGVAPRVTAVIVFTNAYVSVRGTVRGVNVININFLERWLAQVPGNVRISKLKADWGKISTQLSRNDVVQPRILRRQSFGATGGH